MPDPRYANCRGCGQKREIVGLLSWTRLCEACGEERLRENVIGIHTKSGPAFEHWARRSLMAAHRALVAAREKAP